MLDTILETLAHIGTLFELPGLARQRAKGPLVRIAIYRRADWTGWEAEKLLLTNDLLSIICNLLNPGGNP